MDTNLKAPFPYFGGKSKVADVVWSYLGDVKQYIEPFFGSGAVLLKRPPTKLDKVYEIVNDKDGFIANVWRSLVFSPDEVAKWCDWPVNHADLNARRKSLIANERRLIDSLQNDPDWHDPKMAGYWIWAASCWIGSGLTRPNATPHLTGDRGVQTKIPHLTGDRGVYQWMRALHARLRNVKVVCGDWKRVCGGNWQDNNKPVGMFFDPPYATKGRDESIYHHDSMTVGKEVEAWVLERGANQNYRIVVAGYDDEYTSLLKAGWDIHEWSANGGYANMAKVKGKLNRHRERLFISPYCIAAERDKMGLFAGVEK
ncbi:MAG: DNA adenine methylase [Phycisphaerae bacterium]|nr:DNA adenine methylase [Phycisphaerae bacterium]